MVEYKEQTLDDNELQEIAFKLDKVKESGPEALALLKFLDDKAISEEQLRKTLIGKRLTAIKDNYQHDSELSKDIFYLKTLLKKKWKNIINRAKQKQENSQKISSKISQIRKLPYIKGGLSSYSTGEKLRDLMRLKLIELMQTPQKDQGEGFQYSEALLSKGVETGCQMETELFKLYRNDTKRQAKFRSIVYALGIKYSQLKVKILSGYLACSDVVKMEPDDFLTEEQKELKKKEQQLVCDANRTDWFQSQFQEKTEGFFTCRVCKSKHTSYHQMQTRSADEPMTTFIKCLDCGKSWKEY